MRNGQWRPMFSQSHRPSPRLSSTTLLPPRTSACSGPLVALVVELSGTASACLKSFGRAHRGGSGLPYDAIVYDSGGADDYPAVLQRMHVHAPCGLHLVDATNDAAACAKIASRAAQVAVGLTLTKGDQQGWRRFFCEEYVASPGWPVPPFGPSAPAAPLPGATGRVHCPASAPTLQIYAYSNRPGPWLCAFLRTAAFAGAPVTVVGWEPQGFVRVRHRLKLLATMFCCICHRTPRRSRTRCGTRSTSYTHG